MDQQGRRVRLLGHLRLVARELQMADVRQQVTLTLPTDSENYTSFPPATTCPPLPPSWTRSWLGAPPSPRSASPPP